MSEELPTSKLSPERLSLLYQVSNVIHSTLDSQEALQLIVSEAVRVMRASSGSLVLINPTTNFLEIHAAQNLSSAARKLKLRVGEGITGWVARHGKPARVGDVTQDKRYVSVRRDVRSELAVPLEVQGEVRGVINVDSERVDAFSRGRPGTVAGTGDPGREGDSQHLALRATAVESDAVRVARQRQPHDQFHVEPGRGVARHHQGGVRTDAGADVFAHAAGRIARVAGLARELRRGRRLHQKAAPERRRKV